MAAEATSTLHYAYEWSIPADHPARRRYDQAMLDVRAHLGAGDKLTAESLVDVLGPVDAAVDAMLEAVGSKVEAFYAPNPAACRCVFYAQCARDGDTAAHDQLVADLAGHNGVEGLARFYEHLVHSEECDEAPPRMRWPDLELFVAQHNWPDPVSTQTLAALIAHGFRGRHELRQLERQLAGR